MFTLLESPHAGFSLHPEVRSSSSLPHLRSAVLTEWYNSSSPDDIFVFIDNDQTFTPDDFYRLITCESDVCGGLYRIYGGANSNYPNCQFGPKGLAGFLAGDSEVLATATGFMAIKKPILSKIVRHLKQTRGRVVPVAC